MKRHPQGAKGHPNREERLDAIVSDYLDALRAGGAPCRDEVIARNQELASELERFFADLGRFDVAAADLPDAAGLLSGRVPDFRDYELEEELGRGGMGVVYRARQLGLDRTVALKVILAGAFASPVERERFRREATAAAELDHPNIVPVYEMGEQDGVHYFSMKLMEGGSLADRKRGFDQEPRAAADLVRKLAGAVHHAHGCGVAHRDLKPANVLLDRDGEPHVCDFGLAKRMDVAEGLTRTGAVLGTPRYLAPEQVSEKYGRVSAATDVYSLGTILFELLTRRPPFRAPSSMDTLRSVVEDEPPRPRSLNARVPVDLESVCLKCLEKEPRRRYSTALGLQRDLERFLGGLPVEARRVSSVERGRRWCRRHPAATAIGGLLLVIAIGSTFSAVQLHRERLRTEESLWRASLTQAESLAVSGRRGQRTAGLEAVRVAANLRPSLELRSAAAASLALMDLEVIRWEGHPPETVALELDPTMKLCARGYADGAVSVIEIERDRELARLPGEGEKAFVHRFSPDGRLLAVKYRVFGAGRARIWDWAGREEVLDLADVVQSSLAFDPDSRRIACATRAGLLRVIELDTKKESARLGAGSVMRVEFDPRGIRLSWLTGGSVKIWEVGPDRPAVGLTHDEPVDSYAWHPGGDLLATGSGGRVAIWDVRSRRRVRTFEAATFAGTQVVFDHAGDLMVTTGLDGVVHFRDPSGTVLLRHHGQGYRRLFSRDDRLFGFFVNDRTVEVWRVERSRVFRSFCGGSRESGDLEFHPGGRLLAYSIDSGVGILDAARGRPLGELRIGATDSVLFRPRSGDLVTAGPEGVYGWPVQVGKPDDPGTGKETLLRIGPPRDLAPGLGRLAPLPSFGGNSSRGDASDDHRDGFERSLRQISGRGRGRIALSSDDRYLAVHDRSEHAVLLDLEEDGRIVSEFRHFGLTWVAVSRNGRWVATGPYHGLEVLVCDGRTAEIVWRSPRLANRVNTRVFFSSRDRYLVASSNLEYRVWDVGTWKLVQGERRSYRDLGPAPIALSQDERTLAVSPSRQEVELIDVEEGRELVTLRAPGSAPLLQLGFSADASSLACSVMDHGIQLWNLRRLRSRLDDLGLDWEPPPSRPEEPDDAPELELIVDYGDTGWPRRR